MPYKTVLTVKSGKTTYRIRVEQLAYAYHYNDINWLRIFGRRLEEKIYIDDTLDSIEAMLNPASFTKITGNLW